MSEYRKDPILDRWVILAAERAERPQPSAVDTALSPTADCPFCEGRESETPSEVLAYRTAGSPANVPGWQLRVVPNKYPAVADGGQLWEASELVTGQRPVLRDASPPVDGFFTSEEGLGVHEVVVESPRHVVLLSELSTAELALVLRAWRERLLAFRASGRWKYAVVFKNVGGAAGASLAHAHSQLIALPFVPPAVVEKLAASASWYARNVECAHCRLLEEELVGESRLVAQSTGFVAICPYASRFAYETLLAPRRHASRFEESSDAELLELASILREVVGRIECAVGCRDYNVIIQNAPFDSGPVEHYHWHIEVIPRLTRVAGFEWGGGCFINTVPPELAAESLRAVPVD